MAARLPARGFASRGGIRWRVILATILVVGVALGAAGTILLVVLHQRLVDGVDAAQGARAVELAARASSTTGTIAEPSGDASLTQIISPAGVVVAASANVEGEPPLLRTPPAVRARTAVTTTTAPLDTGTEFRIVAQPVTLPTGPGWIYVATSLAPVTVAVDQLRTLFLIAFPLVLAAIAGLAWLAVGQSLRPVENIRRRAAEITAADLGQRVPVPSGRDEVARLAVTMNDLLHRLEDAAARQRQFVGDASHELRSPLAALRVELDLATADPHAPDDIRRMRSQVERMTVLLDDLLFLARSDEAQTPRPDETVDLDEIVLREAARLRGLGGPTVGVRSLDAARIQGSTRDLARLVRNLGDNAHDHAHATIELALRARDGWIELAVSDDGDGIPPGDRERIFERFTRLDDARVRHTSGGGTGLGLAIARTITESVGGTLTAEDRSDQRPGTRFLVRIPAPVTPTDPATES